MTDSEAIEGGLEQLAMNPPAENETEPAAPADDPGAAADPANVADDGAKSALEANIQQKGKNAYYYAHGHKANGPKWDGKAEPKLLGTRSVSGDELSTKQESSFNYAKSNITSYAFSDEGMSVKLYITMEDVGEICADEDITLEYTENSFCLTVNNYTKGNKPDVVPTVAVADAENADPDGDAPSTTASTGTTAAAVPPPTPQCLSFGKLTANITKATYKKKKDRIIVTLKKEKEGEWHTVNDKGTPDHELV